MLIKIRCCDPICASRTLLDRETARRAFGAETREDSNSAPETQVFSGGTERARYEPRVFVDVNEGLVDPESPVKKRAGFGSGRPGKSHKKGQVLEVVDRPGNR